MSLREKKKGLLGNKTELFCIVLSHHYLRQILTFVYIKSHAFFLSFDSTFPFHKIFVLIL